MDEDPTDLPDGGEDERDRLETSGSAGSADWDSSEAAMPLTVDQRALNIIGLAQARERLRAVRSHGDPGDPVEVQDEDELQASVDRHPAARARRDHQV